MAVRCSAFTGVPRCTLRHTHPRIVKNVSAASALLCIVSWFAIMDKRFCRCRSEASVPRVFELLVLFPLRTLPFICEVSHTRQARPVNVDGSKQNK